MVRSKAGKPQTKPSRYFINSSTAESSNPIYDATHSDFKAATSEKDFIALLDAVHRKLGLVQSSERDGWTVNAANFKVNVSLRYKTKFAEGDAFEAFTYRVEGEKALLLGYNINSQTLITK